MRSTETRWIAPQCVYNLQQASSENERMPICIDDRIISYDPFTAILNIACCFVA